MALAGPTLLTADPDTANAASYVTPTVSPTANGGILVGVWNTDGTNAILPTLSSGFAISGSWTQEATLQATAATRRVTLFSAKADASPGSGTITADFGGDSQTGCTIIAVEYTGQDGTDFVLQPATSQTGAGATSLALTLAGALASATNQMCCFIGHNTNEDQTEGGGGTELASSDVGYATPDARFACYSAVNDNSLSASWTTSSAALAIGCEVVEASGGTSETPTPGGAVAAGNALLATVAVVIGGALGAGTAATAQTALAQGGALAQGVAPAFVVASPQGGATAQGTGPAPALVAVSAGGSTAGGVAPTDSSAVSETPTPGGVNAAGLGPAALASATTGGALGQGVGATANVTFSSGGATAGGQLTDPNQVVVLGHFDMPTPTQVR